MSRITRSTGSSAGCSAASPQPQRPVRRALAEERLDVAHGDLGVVVAHLVGDDPSGRADRAQQRAGERARPGAGLEHGRARVDVAHA